MSDAARKIEPATMSIAEAADYLGVSVSLLRKMAKLGRGPRVCMIESVMRYRIQSLDEYLDACEATPCPSTSEDQPTGSSSNTPEPSTVSARVKQIEDEQRRKRVLSTARLSLATVRKAGDEE